HGFSEPQALAALDDYFTANVGADVSVWAMPPEFDLVILRNVADAHGVSLPWKYNKTRDLRTLEYLAGCSSKDRMQAAVAHDAGSDAAAQASTAI
ncbi:MAG TPA: 3'-5' exoribonuclease, partial [Terricaulis sp.]|nr:3'-5' exoribonuclease [Terricaulis sp.]